MGPNWLHKGFQSSVQMTKHGIQDLYFSCSLGSAETRRGICLQIQMGPKCISPLSCCLSFIPIGCLIPYDALGMNLMYMCMCIHTNIENIYCRNYLRLHFLNHGIHTDWNWNLFYSPNSSAGISSTA